jgi:hypothetical protein
VQARPWIAPLPERCKQVVADFGTEGLLHVPRRSELADR